MFQLQPLKLFGFCMEVYAIDRPRNLVEADVIESLKTRSRYLLHPVVGYQEIFLPAHKYVLLLRKVL